MRSIIKTLTLVLAFSLLYACQSSSTEGTKIDKKETKMIINAPDFDSEAAFLKVKKQLDFGVRVPNTKGHVSCGDWIVKTLADFNLEVQEQEFEAYSFEGKILKARNIIGSYNVTATKRILLAAHWDTRAVADQDTERKSQPIPGANDGGSGVAILLQIAEEISRSETKPDIGIDYIFFDAEDGGKPESFLGNSMNDYGGYLMGSEYWAKSPHKENYSAYYGVLVDMVGGYNATFYKDKISMRVAPSVVNKIWNTAASKGYGSLFLPSQGGDILDDHIPVIQHREIPMIDIIDQKINSEQVFYEHWHKHSDDLEAIDSNTLKAVGETLLQTLYNENGVINKPIN
ncbi:MAG: glutaminyl-peptide cyclotransferase [Algoriphagus sp.]|jgi:glutaminyl-peptide cyclotransferase